MAAGAHAILIPEIHCDLEPVAATLGLRFGGAAVRAMETGHNGVMVALDPPNVTYVPLVGATHRMKTVPPDGDTILTARDLGISFGDAMP